MVSECDAENNKEDAQQDHRRAFGFVHSIGNAALYKMSHAREMDFHSRRSWRCRSRGAGRRPGLGAAGAATSVSEAAGLQQAFRGRQGHAAP
jgi:hypothetical protein